eukprot:scaffold128046_cov22-Tisochrysis_lutea.AAC.1
MSTHKPGLNSTHTHDMQWPEYEGLDLNVHALQTKFLEEQVQKAWLEQGAHVLGVLVHAGTHLVHAIAHNLMPANKPGACSWLQAECLPACLMAQSFHKAFQRCTFEVCACKARQASIRSLRVHAHVED